MFTVVLKKVAGAIDTHRALRWLSDIQGFDRWSTFERYQQCGHYIAERMRESGLDDVSEIALPADGRTRYGDWTMPLAWDVSDASLELVAPSASHRLLADYATEPACLAAWSAATSPEGDTLRVVRVDDGRHDEDYVEEVRDAVVLTKQPSVAVRRQATRRGARGIISDAPANERRALAHSRAWVNAWSDGHGWAHLATDTPLFGFQLDRETGEYLRGATEHTSQVWVRAKVHSSLHQGTLLAPTGVLCGAADESVLVFGHSYEYGAEDNAAGCAVILEALRVLAYLVRQGELPAPRRSIRGLISWECYGSIAWCVAHRHRAERVIAGLCVDDIAGKATLTGGVPKLVRNAHAQASFTDALASAVARAAYGRPIPSVPWMAGTDSAIFADPAFDIPMPWLTDSPARYHHTSLDRAINIDPTAFGQATAFCACYLYALANADSGSVPWLAQLTRGDWARRLKHAYDDSLGRLGQSSDEASLATAVDGASELVRHVCHRGMAAIESVLRLGKDAAARLAVEEATGALCALQGQLLARLADNAATLAAQHGWEALGHHGSSRQPGGTLAPKRRVPGILTLTGLSAEDEERLMAITGGRNPMWSAPLILALYWCDGSRTVGEISRLLRLELGSEALEGLDLSAYMAFLEEKSLISLRPG